MCTSTLWVQISEMVGARDKHSDVSNRAVLIRLPQTIINKVESRRHLVNMCSAVIEMQQSRSTDHASSASFRSPSVRMKSCETYPLGEGAMRTSKS